MRENLQKIKDACIKANPEIMVEKCYGCGEIKCDRSTTGCPMYIGRPIRLADVLMMLNENFGDDVYTIGKHGATHKPVGDFVLHNWILSDDNLEHQSEDTINFIAGLL